MLQHLLADSRESTWYRPKPNRDGLSKCEMISSMVLKSPIVGGRQAHIIYTRMMHDPQQVQRQIAMDEVVTAYRLFW